MKITEETTENKQPKGQTKLETSETKNDPDPESNQKANYDKMMKDLERQRAEFEAKQKEYEAREQVLAEQEKLQSQRRSEDEAEMREYYQDQLGMTPEQKAATKEEPLSYFKKLRELQKLQFNLGGNKGVPKNPTQPVKRQEKKDTKQGYYDYYTNEWV